MKTNLEILIETREYLAQPFHWTKYRLAARHQDGFNQYCMRGAFYKFSGCDNIDVFVPLMSKAIQACYPSLEYYIEESVGTCIEDFNDRFDIGVEDILRVLDYAIEQEKKRIAELSEPAEEPSGDLQDKVLITV